MIISAIPFMEGRAFSVMHCCGLVTRYRELVTILKFCNELGSPLRLRHLDLLRSVCAHKLFFKWNKEQNCALLAFSSSINLLALGVFLK